MPALVPVPPLPEDDARILGSVPDGYEYYFDGSTGRPYTRRRWEFPGEPSCMPLVRAFLNTCAAARDAEYRYVFNLLGTELATNAIRHSRSGEPGQTFVLKVERCAGGLALTCRDSGRPLLGPRDGEEPAPLIAAPLGERLTAEDGRGLALVDSLATSWGDNGHPSIRKVWFYLAYDMSGSSWPAA